MWMCIEMILKHKIKYSIWCIILHCIMICIDPIDRTEINYMDSEYIIQQQHYIYNCVKMIKCSSMLPFPSSPDRPILHSAPVGSCCNATMASQQRPIVKPDRVMQHRRQSLIKFLSRKPPTPQKRKKKWWVRNSGPHKSGMGNIPTFTRNWYGTLQD